MLGTTRLTDVNRPYFEGVPGAQLVLQQGVHHGHGQVRQPHHLVLLVVVLLQGLEDPSALLQEQETHHRTGNTSQNRKYIIEQEIHHQNGY